MDLKKHIRNAWVHSVLLASCCVSAGEKTTEYWDYKGVFEVTRYCACEKCCGRYADGRTYLGTDVRYGVVAVDPAIIRLRQEVRVKGFPQVLSAEDIGGAICGYRIDVFHYNHDYCLKWGRQRRKVWVRKKGSSLSKAADEAVDAAHHLGELAVELVALPISFIGELASLEASRDMRWRKGFSWN